MTPLAGVIILFFFDSPPPAAGWGKMGGDTRTPPRGLVGPLEPLLWKPW